jgi:hypothetical protein
MSQLPGPPSATPPPPPQSPAPGVPNYPPPPPGQYLQQPGIPPAIVPQGASAAGIISQFTGNAGWSLLLGVVTIAVPLLLNRVFFFLPIVGFVAAIMAIRRGQLIGGIVGLVLNAIGGLLTVAGLMNG